MAEGLPKPSLFRRGARTTLAAAALALEKGEDRGGLLDDDAGPGKRLTVATVLATVPKEGLSVPYVAASERAGLSAAELLILEAADWERWHANLRKKRAYREKQARQAAAAARRREEEEVAAAAAAAAELGAHPYGAAPRAPQRPAEERLPWQMGGVRMGTLLLHLPRPAERLQQRGGAGKGG